MNDWTWDENFFQNCIDGLQKYIHQYLETLPAYITATFATWHHKALIYLEYKIGGTDKFNIAVKLYEHPHLLREIEIFKQFS